MFSFSKKITCYVKWIFRLGNFRLCKKEKGSSRVGMFCIKIRVIWDQVGAPLEDRLTVAQDGPSDCCIIGFVNQLTIVYPRVTL